MTMLDVTADCTAAHVVLLILIIRTKITATKVETGPAIAKIISPPTPQRPTQTTALAHHQLKNSTTGMVIDDVRKLPPTEENRWYGLVPVRVDVHCRGDSESDDGNDDDDMDCSSSVSSNVETDATAEAQRASEPSTATASENISPSNSKTETLNPPNPQFIQPNPTNMEWSADKTPQDHLPEQNSTLESGVSSPSPSELENKSGIDENDDIKLQKRHSLPRQSSHDSRRSLKRVVSVPATVSPPPPPPPPPTSEESSLSILAPSLPTPNSNKTSLSRTTELEFSNGSPYSSSALTSVSNS
ncbi:unnamed protein product, partial [Nesidiocoris tenuis]